MPEEVLILLINNIFKPCSKTLLVWIDFHCIIWVVLDTVCTPVTLVAWRIALAWHPRMRPLHAGSNSAPMSAWQGPQVPGRLLHTVHTSLRHCQQMTSALCQSTSCQYHVTGSVLLVVGPFLSQVRWSVIHYWTVSVSQCSVMIISDNCWRQTCFGVVCWKSVDNDDDIPVPQMNYLWMRIWLHKPNSDVQRLTHRGQMVPKSDEGRSWACCCRWWWSWRCFSRAWVRSDSNDVTPVLEIDLHDGWSAASDSRSLAGMSHSLRMEWRWSWYLFFWPPGVRCLWTSGVTTEYTQCSRDASWLCTI